jgi:hypothetical protein
LLLISSNPLKLLYPIGCVTIGIRHNHTKFRIGCTSGC